MKEHKLFSGKSLYGALKTVDTIDDILEKNIERFEKSYKKFEGLPGYSSEKIQKLDLKDILEIYTEDIELKLIEDYRTNPILNDAIMKYQSIEDSLLGLSEINKGIKRYLPRRKDEAHNGKVKDMEELIGRLPELKTNGIFKADNAFTFGAYGGIGFMAVMSLGKFPLKADILFSIIFGVGFGSYLNRPKNSPSKIDKAKYLDNKIRENYF